MGRSTMKEIEKVDGCDHITCSLPGGCGHEFCWICLADYKLILQEGNHRHNQDCSHYVVRLAHGAWGTAYDPSIRRRTACGCGRFRRQRPALIEESPTRPIGTEAQEGMEEWVRGGEVVPPIVSVEARPRTTHTLGQLPPPPQPIPTGQRSHPLRPTTPSFRAPRHSNPPAEVGILPGTNTTLAESSSSGDSNNPETYFSPIRQEYFSLFSALQNKARHTGVGLSTLQRTEAPRPISGFIQPMQARRSELYQPPPLLQRQFPQTPTWCRGETSQETGMAYTGPSQVASGSLLTEQQLSSIPDFESEILLDFVHGRA
ncbi:unnamed protein product [Rhizoctonia solani]|uniref:RING-type domain-containing protein n=1 Tax=Rhizoctonia solani TaxID=456999 RepID=A0A8H3A1A5_9AGAM|nr:unnamed protein product [Rhizoctonia solani]